MLALLGTRREGPELKRDENGQIAEIRLPAKKTVALSLLTVMLSFTAGYYFGNVFCRLFGEYYLLRESWQVS